MKKGIAILLVFVMLFSLAGCKSTLRPAIEEYNRYMNVEELSKADMFDETNGFHYKEVQWGMTLQEANKATGTSLARVIGYGQDELMVYESNIRANLLGRINDTSSFATLLEESIVYMVSIAFTQKDRSANEPVTEQQIFDEMLPKLTEYFGEPEYREDVQTSDRVSSLNKTYSWRYTTASGLETELQLSAAYISGAEEPSLASLGFVWHHEALNETEQESAAE